MTTTMRESSHVSTRKTMNHSGHVSGHSSTSANRMENNLDALLEDLQTSVSRPTTNRIGRTSPQVEYRVAANPTRVVTEDRSISPSGLVTTTTEKFVSTGPAGAPSGIPGLEMLDAELQDVQPGQSKTVAYKQVSYQYNKKQDEKPIDSWAMSDNLLHKSDAAMVDSVHERTYEESRSAMQKRSRSPEVATRAVNRELMYSSDSSTKSALRQVSPLPSNHRDVKYVKETSYLTEPTSAQKNVTTIRTDETEEMTNVEYIPPSTTTIPLNLAPGPNTKVTTTIKTYTYELPGAPQQYLPSGSLSKNVDKTITYTLPRDSPTEKMVTYQVDEKKSNMYSARSESHQSPTRLHREEKVYVEEHQGYRPSSPSVVQTSNNTMTRNEKYAYINGYSPRGPGDYPDHSQSTKVEKHIIYQNEPVVPVNHESRSTTINQYEEHFSSNRPPSRGVLKPSSPTRPYYPSSESHSSTTVYKYSNESASPTMHRKSPDDHQVLLPKPFPTGGVKVYPTNGTPTSPRRNETGPPKKLEDLMASFSDSEKEVLEDIEIHERHHRKSKKEVDFIPHTPPKVHSKNIAGPPVYYPPGSAEFSRKEESMGAMSHASGGWAKERGKYEYQASSRESEKVRTKKAVVPICLPLCCALPCVIM